MSRHDHSRPLPFPAATRLPWWQVALLFIAAASISLVPLKLFTFSFYCFSHLGNKQMILLLFHRLNYTCENDALSIVLSYWVLILLVGLCSRPLLEVVPANSITLPTKQYVTVMKMCENSRNLSRVVKKDAIECHKHGFLGGDNIIFPAFLRWKLQSSETSLLHE
jgi:hypothetical protein